MQDSDVVIFIYQFGDEVSPIEYSWWIENEGVCNSRKDIKHDNKQVWPEKRLPSHHLQFCPLSALFLARACFILLAEHISALQNLDRFNIIFFHGVGVLL